MTPEVLTKTQELFDEGLNISEVSKKLRVSIPTLKYSIKVEKLKVRVKKTVPVLQQEKVNEQ